MLLLLLAAPPPAPTPEPNPWLTPTAILTYVVIGIAIIAVIFAWRQVYYAKRRQYKELTYSVLVDTPILSVDTRVEREKIHIFYDQQEVKDTSLVLLKVWNSGTEDVRIYRHDEQPADSFESPYWFVLERRSVIARSILETDPPHFIEKHDAEVYNQTPDPRPGAVSLPHCLLKPKRSFTIRMLLTGPTGGIKTEGQLVDCDLKEYQRQDTLVLLLTTFAGVGAGPRKKDFCPFCGRKIGSVKECPYCGEKVA